MGVVIEICVKYPGGPTRNKGTDILIACRSGLNLNLNRTCVANVLTSPVPFQVAPELGIIYMLADLSCS
jgi:hypothetical protein